MSKQKHYTKKPTGYSTWTFYCHADVSLKGPYEKLTAKAKQEFADNGGVDCDGSFNPGPWCEACRFGGKHESEETEVTT